MRLNVNENPYAPSPAVVESIARAAAGVAGRLNRYPDRDFPALRRALADYLAAESGVRPDWEGVWAANGSNIGCGGGQNIANFLTILLFIIYLCR